MKKYILGFFLSCLVMMCASSLHAQTDSDNDGMPDGWETQYSLNPLSNADAEFDNDSDLLKNLYEYQHGTNPLLADTDNDGLLDGDEVLIHGDEFRIYDANGPAGVASNGSNYFVTWTYLLGNKDVLGQLCDNNGSKIGSVFKINSYTDYFQRYPSLATNENNYLVAWQSIIQDGSYDGIFGQFYNNDGTPIGSEFQINSYTTNYQSYPSVSSNGNTYLVTWDSYDQDGSYEGVFGQFYDNDGNVLGSEFRINTYTKYSQYSSSVSSNSNNYLVVWTSSYQDGSYEGVFGQFYDNDGNALGSEFRINTYTTYAQYSPSVSSNGNNYLVVWTSANQDGSYEGVFGKFYDNDGSPIGSEFQVNSYTTDDQSYPSVSSNGNTYLVTWDCYAQDDSYKGVFGQFYTDDGTPIGSEFQISSYTEYDPPDPAVSSNGRNYLVTWISNSGIYGKIIYGIYSSNPLNADTDLDMLSDYEETYGYHTNPVNPDSDGDSLPDGEEINFGTNPLNPDTDNDGMTDGWEYQYNHNPASDADKDTDPDNDGLTNIKEFNYGTAPTNSDTDNDGLSDSAELFFIRHNELIDTPDSEIYQLFPEYSDSIVASTGSSILVFWREKQESTEWNIPYDWTQAQILTPQGIPVGDSFIVDNWESIASNGSTYCIVYLQDNDTELHIELLNDEANTTGNALDVSVNVDSYRNVAITSDMHNYLITWMEKLGDDANIIKGLLIDNEANVLKQPFTIAASNDILINTKYAIVCDGERYFLAYGDGYHSSNVYRAYGQFLDLQGNPQGTSFIIFTKQGTESFLDSEVRQLIVADGGFLLLYSWNGVSASTNTIFRGVEFLDNTGQVIDVDNLNEYQFKSMVDASSNHQTGELIAKAIYHNGQFLFLWNKLSNANFNYQLLDRNFEKIDNGMINSPYVYEENSDLLIINNNVFTTYEHSKKMYGAMLNFGYSTNPLNYDTDNDSMPDGWEVDNSLNPIINDTDDDIDNDGLTNIEEFYHGTAPNNPDTDNDGMDDGDEIRLFMEPDNADSLFCITYCGFEASSSGITLEWQGSASNPDVPYKIFWSDDPNNPWNEAVVESGDILDNDGIRTWIDEGDNDSIVPRPAPDNAVFRLYKVVAE
ncbi:MAG: hypothetical protein AB1454_05940 [Candidatus Auribacterota bacterium]